MKRYLLSLTKRELRGLLLACEAELFYHQLHDEKAEARRYRRLCKLLEQRLENAGYAERVSQ